MTEQSATADVRISASPSQVWQALTDPEQIREYFFGARVDTSWEPGSPITWRGEYDGRPFEDKGEVLEVEPEQRLVMTHYSPLTGRPDTPENYHRLTWSLRDDGDRTEVQVDQSLTDGETEGSAQENWSNVLRQLKEHVERG
ncbi:SRPBCC domain-containing protein [Nocardioides albidus]|uniref:SRPBCC domain-containing protein n=1 Tax=Nocardioides albidus TaxID=1517589 RepID=A0A5C4VNS0_9ACTN|nr:SRPBCC domain-containing protein [Nocardioides albidus]TNM37482.1 SRPBCC domain-containing protein [Nocardioides albidus]